MALCRLLPFYCSYTQIQNEQESKSPKKSPIDKMVKWTPSQLLEGKLLPVIMNICVQDEIESEWVWNMTEALGLLWKETCMGAHRAKLRDSEFQNISRICLRYFHLILRILPVEKKIELFTNRMIPNLSSLTDPFILHWVPKLVELAIPFLQDESRTVRKAFSEYVIKLITLHSLCMDRAPSVARKRETKGIVGKLKESFSVLPVSRILFPRSGPRPVHHGLGKSFVNATVPTSLDQEPLPVKPNQDVAEQLDKPVLKKVLSIATQIEQADQDEEISLATATPNTKKSWDDAFFNNEHKPDYDIHFEMDEMIASIAHTNEHKQSIDSEALTKLDDTKAQPTPSPSNKSPGKRSSSITVVPLLDNQGVHVEENKKSSRPTPKTYESWGDDMDADVELDDIHL